MKIRLYGIAYSGRGNMQIVSVMTELDDYSSPDNPVYRTIETEPIMFNRTGMQWVEERGRFDTDLDRLVSDFKSKQLKDVNYYMSEIGRALKNRKTIDAEYEKAKKIREQSEGR